MAELLETNHLLAFFLVVGAGAALGAIRFGPLRFGAAGALFVGLAVSAWDPNIGNDMKIVQQIGLAFFVYTVGISAGAMFFQDLRKQTSLLASAAIVSLLGALAAAFGGHLLHLPKGLTLGIFTGSLTAAPALDAATRVTGDPQAAVGYAFGYPIGVIVGILVVTMTVTRKWVGAKDTPSLAGKSLETLTVRVTETVNTRHVRAWREQRVRMSYLRRGNITRVVVPGEDLQEGDLILLVGDPENIEEAASQVGVAVDHHLEDDRSGDSEKRVSEVDAMAFGIGMVLGMLLGALPFPIPGGATFELGSAAGPLIVGMLLGALRRTGPLVWSLPTSANLTIRQIGLLLFLAGLGLGAGPQLFALLTSPEGPKAALLAFFLVLLCCVAQALAGRFAGLSAARSAGGVAGFLGQPAVLQAADARVADERIEAAYATLFAFTIIVKILLVPLIWSI